MATSENLFFQKSHAENCTIVLLGFLKWVFRRLSILHYYLLFPNNRSLLNQHGEGYYFFADYLDTAVSFYWT